MHLITYISESTIGENDLKTEIDNIVKTAKSNNSKDGITGVLFYLDQKFLQVIEGREDNLRRLMKSIASDKRHQNVQYLIDTPVEKRGFSDWNMDSFRLKSDQMFDQAVLRKLTESFKENLVPRSDMLVYYYKKLLEEQSHKGGRSGSTLYSIFSLF